MPGKGPTSRLVFARAMQRGWTPLHIACDNGHKEMMEVLLERGADMEARDKVPLHVLCAVGWMT